MNCPMVTTLKENFYQGSTVGQETSPKLEEIGINKINNQRDEEPKSQMDIMIENFQKKTPETNHNSLAQYRRWKFLHQLSKSDCWIN